ncbi:hypothetical protein FI667_g6797, partial [Globisporangium splendens]
MATDSGSSTESEYCEEEEGAEDAQPWVDVKLERSGEGGTPDAPKNTKRVTTTREKKEKRNEKTMARRVLASTNQNAAAAATSSWRIRGGRECSTAHAAKVTYASDVFATSQRTPGRLIRCCERCVKAKLDILHEIQAEPQFHTGVMHKKTIAATKHLETHKTEAERRLVSIKKVARLARSQAALLDSEAKKPMTEAEVVEFAGMMRQLVLDRREYFRKLDEWTSKNKQKR